MTTDPTPSKAPAGRLQRHHLEIALIIISGIRLCCAVASLGGAGSWWLAACFGMLHTLAPAIEFSSKELGSPFKTRNCESHGLAQGILAVPSVLAALASASPQADTWRSWLLGSCIAAFSVLAIVTLQSHFASVAHKQVACLQQPGAAQQLAELQPNATAGNSHSPQNGLFAEKQHSLQSPVISRRHQQQQQHFRKNQQQGKTAITAVCCLAAVSVLYPASVNNCTSGVASWWFRQQHPVEVTASSLWGGQVLQAGIAAAVLAPALYCIIMHLLPGCFSIGEGALMAQGAAGLAAVAALVVPDAVLFVPTGVCQMLPSAAASALTALGGCTSTSHARALQLEVLPSVILLILASTLLICLLLRALLDVLGSQGSRDYNSKQTAHVSAGSQPSVDTTGQKPCPTNSCSNGQERRLAAWLLAAAIAGAVVIQLLWLGCTAAWTLLEFLPARPRRLLMLLYWAGLLSATLPVLGLWASHSKCPQIIVRKVYHLLAGGLFVPVFFWDLQLLCLSLAIAFAALVLLEVLRKMHLPLLGPAVQRFMQDFVDERDSGVIYVTHFTLLLGLAIPIWLCLGLPGVQQTGMQPAHTISSSFQCSAEASSGISNGSCVAAGTAAAGPRLSQHVNSSGQLLLVMAGLSGMVIIGVGDTAASMVGKLLGQVPIHAGSRKTMEGTVAGTVSSLGAWCLLLWFGDVGGGSWQWWLQLLLATFGAGLMEAVTSQLDNILLPLWYMPHLMLVHQ